MNNKSLKILMAHNYYRTLGGEDISFETEALILKNSGHEVYTVTCKSNEYVNRSMFNQMINALWNHKVFRQSNTIIKKHKIDIVHVQNWFPFLSLSIFFAAKINRVPVTMTIRNYRPACIKGTLYRNKKNCTLCINDKYMGLRSVYYKCYRNSFLYSLFSWGILTFFFRLKVYKRLTSKIICVSEFVKSVLYKTSIKKSMIEVKYNCLIENNNEQKHNPSHYCVVIGRLEFAKGVEQLMKHWDKATDLPPLYHIGPFSNKIVYSNVKQLGTLTHSATIEVIQKSKLLICPSVWDEPFGRTVLEGAANQVPVLAFNVGGIPEFQKYFDNIFLFAVKDWISLIQKARDLTSKTDCEKSSATSTGLPYFPSINASRLLEIYIGSIKIP